MTRSDMPQEKSQALTFFVSGDEYAIGILQVKEIIEYELPTRVPAAPLSIAGVINLRGSVVPVVDLALKFGLPQAAVTKRTCIIIVEVHAEDGRLTMGVLADSVSQVIDLAAGDIEPPPNFGARVRSDFLAGMARNGRKFVLLLDIDRALSTTELLAAAAINLPTEQPDLAVSATA